MSSLPELGIIRSAFFLYSRTMLVDTSITTPTVPAGGAAPTNYWAFPSTDYGRQLDVFGRPRGLALIGLAVGADDAGFRAKIFGWSKVYTGKNSIEYTPLVDLTTLDFQNSTITKSSYIEGSTLAIADTVARITDIPSGIATMPGCTSVVYSPGSNSAPGVAALIGVPNFIDGITIAVDIDGHATAAAVTSANFFIAPIFGD